MVALKKVSDEELIAAFKTYGSPQKVSQVLKIDVGTVYRRRAALKDVSLPSFAKDNIQSPTHTSQITAGLYPTP